MFKKVVVGLDAIRISTCSLQPPLAGSWRWGDWQDCTSVVVIVRCFFPRTHLLQMTILLKTALPWTPRTEENTLIFRLPTGHSLSSDSGRKTGTRPYREMDPDLSSWISQTSLTYQKQISMGRIPTFRYKFSLACDVLWSYTRSFYWTKWPFSLASMLCSQFPASLPKRDYMCSLSECPDFSFFFWIFLWILLIAECRYQYRPIYDTKAIFAFAFWNILSLILNGYFKFCFQLSIVKFVYEQILF